MLPEKASIRENLWKELEKSGLIPDCSRYKTVRRLITEFGLEETASLQKELGGRRFDMILRMLNTKYPSDDLTRILGFGHAMTLYLILPVTRYEMINVDIIQLGARANLIISLFDHMVDSGKRSTRILTERDLESLIEKRGKEKNIIINPFINPENLIMTDLIGSYLKKLYNLGSVHEKLMDLQISLIKSMFMAELSTLNTAEENPLLLRRKAALPFMVMGIPSIFNIYENNGFIGPFAHLIWLYRIGLYIGSIDDIIDIHQDIMNNHPNQFKKYLTEQKENLLSGEFLKIISAGLSVKETWEKKVTDSNPYLPDFTRDILGTCVVSWFGGISNYNISE